MEEAAAGLDVRFHRLPAVEPLMDHKGPMEFISQAVELHAPPRSGGHATRRPRGEPWSHAAGRAEQQPKVRHRLPPAWRAAAMRGLSPPTSHTSRWPLLRPSTSHWLVWI